mmetsp:Transcript_21972/g.51512  ORF Transcript_21972/g.51512 Transcript_21972/m.51512 type:complete len:218 (+) Transcript_21972:3998-4651(+)
MAATGEPAPRSCQDPTRVPATVPPEVLSKASHNTSPINKTHTSPAEIGANAELIAIAASSPEGKGELVRKIAVGTTAPVSTPVLISKSTEGGNILSAVTPPVTGSPPQLQHLRLGLAASSSAGAVAGTDTQQWALAKSSACRDMQMMMTEGPSDMPMEMMCDDVSAMMNVASDHVVNHCTPCSSEPLRPAMPTEAWEPSRPSPTCAARSASSTASAP